MKKTIIGSIISVLLLASLVSCASPVNDTPPYVSEFSGNAYEANSNFYIFDETGNGGTFKNFLGEFRFTYDIQNDEILIDCNKIKHKEDEYTYYEKAKFTKNDNGSYTFVYKQPEIKSMYDDALLFDAYYDSNGQCPYEPDMSKKEAFVGNKIPLLDDSTSTTGEWKSIKNSDGSYNIEIVVDETTYTFTPFEDIIGDTPFSLIVPKNVMKQDKEVFQKLLFNLEPKMSYIGKDKSKPTLLFSEVSINTAGFTQKGAFENEYENVNYVSNKGFLEIYKNKDGKFIVTYSDNITDKASFIANAKSKTFTRDEMLAFIDTLTGGVN